MLADALLQQVIQALNTDYYVESPMDDLEPVELDPVARLTDESQQTTTLPDAFEQQVDLMTSTQKETRIAEKTFEQMSDPGSSGSFQAAQAATLPGLTTGDFVRQLLARKGSEYEWGGTSKATGFDCSGLLNRVLGNNGITIPRTSGEIYAHSKKISVEKAMKTRGAILWTDGHIAVSLGNGKTIEARGEDYGVVIADAAGRFSGGGLLPELKLSKSTQEAKRSKLRVAPQVPVDPLNKLEGISSLTSAPLVFGAVMGETYAPKTKASVKAPPGLGFVPARYRSMIQAAAEKTGLPARLLAVIAKHESGFASDVMNFSRTSSAGALGPMQVMPLHEATYGSGFMNNARKNFMVGARIFASYLNKADGDLRRALAFYNAGPNASEALIQARMAAYSDPILDDFYGRAA